jgi:hypothetical protein
VSLFFIPTAHGQITTPVPTDAHIETLLRSERAIDVAWGAFWSAQFRRAAAIPDLLRAFETPPSGPDVDRELVAVEVLDALVQLDATVPAAAVRPYYDRWPVQALALWGKATPGRDEILVALLREARKPYRAFDGSTKSVLRTARHVSMDEPKRLHGRRSNAYRTRGIPCRTREDEVR